MVIQFNIFSCYQIPQSDSLDISLIKKFSFCSSLQSTLALISCCLLALSAVLANPLPANISLSDDVEKVPISFEDVIVNGLGARGFSGTWISGKGMKYLDHNFILRNLRNGWSIAVIHSKLSYFVIVSNGYLSKVDKHCHSTVDTDLIP